MAALSPGRLKAFWGSAVKSIVSRLKKRHKVRRDINDHQSEHPLSASCISGPMYHTGVVVSGNAVDNWPRV